MKNSIRFTLVLTLLCVVPIFAFGVIVGVYRIWPWPIVYSLGQKVNNIIFYNDNVRNSVNEDESDTEAAPPTSQATAEEKTLTRRINGGILNTDLTIVNPHGSIAGDGGTITSFEGKVYIARENNGTVLIYNPEDDIISKSSIILPNNNKNSLPIKGEDGEEVRYTYKHRYNGLSLFERENKKYIAASFSYYDIENNCVTSRLSLAELAEGIAGIGVKDWKLIFESSPCLPFKEKGQPVVDSAQAGGRLIYFNNQLFMTIGDHGYDGNHLAPPMPQLPNNDYGSIIAVDMHDLSHKTISKGHRNPQGIAVDNHGTIWSTEQGPMGGDELNLIIEGRDYGWPTVTLGTDYTSYEEDQKEWSSNPEQGRHNGFEAPIYSWIPSIAPSGLEYIDNFHPYWNGDLVVPTLRGQALHRLRTNENHVVFEERLPLDRRVRDLTIAAGRIYILFDDGKFGYLSPREPNKLEPSIFTSSTNTTLNDLGCAQCHTSSSAPKLAGILGKSIGRQDGVTYSTALSEKNEIWDAENLAKFLRNPENFAPGTTMPSPSLSDEQISKIINVLTSDQ